jgi:hypothetical protein
VGARDESETSLASSVRLHPISDDLISDDLISDDLISDGSISDGSLSDAPRLDEEATAWAGTTRM